MMFICNRYRYIYAHLERGRILKSLQSTGYIFSYYTVENLHPLSKAEYKSKNNR